MVAKDRYANCEIEKDEPSGGVVSITPIDDTPGVDTELPYVTRAVKVNGADGYVACVFMDGSESLELMLAGVLYPFRIKKVKFTGTTATQITGYL